MNLQSSPVRPVQSLGIPYHYYILLLGRPLQSYLAMSFLKISLASAVTLLSFAPSAHAGFDASASNNVAVYWGMFVVHEAILEEQHKEEAR